MTYLMISLKSIKVKTIPLYNSKILLIDNFLKKNFFLKLVNEISLLEEKSVNVKSYNVKSKSQKKEFLDYNEYFPNQKKLVKYLSSKKFTKFLKRKLTITNNLFPDKAKMFSGFNIVSKNGFLRPHADFNFNSQLKKYRTINLLIYFNKNWKNSYGGNLAFYDYSNLKKKYEFLAKANRALIFLTNKFTPHGYRKIKINKKRFSLNFYYYTNENLSFSNIPHKTIWR